MRLWVLACLLAVCLVAANARSTKNKAKDEDGGAAAASSAQSSDRSINTANEGSGDDGGEDDDDDDDDGKGRIREFAGASLESLGSRLLSKIKAKNVLTNYRNKSSGKNSSRKNSSSKNSSNKKSSRKNSSSKNSSRKNESRGSCGGGFGIFSFLKAFGLRRFTANSEDGDAGADNSECQEVAGCTLLAVGRLALRDCNRRLQEAGLALESSGSGGADLDSQFEAVTTDLRACMALLEATPATTQPTTEPTSTTPPMMMYK